MSNWSNKAIDDAGYLIDTESRLSAIAKSLTEMTGPATASQALFVGDDPADVRAENARSLRLHAAALLAIANELDGQVIDQSR